MSSLARLLSRVAPSVLLGLLFALVSPAGAQSDIPTLSFGSVAVGMTSTQVVTANTGNIKFSLAVGSEYTISTTTCVPDPNIGYDCTANVTFTPGYPGQHLDAVFAPNSDGRLTPIAYLTGTGTSPQLGFNFGAAAGYSPPVNQPSGLAIGPDGAFYVSSLGDHAIYRFSKDGRTQTTVDFNGFGTINPGALAVDGSNSLYVADTVSNRVYVHTNNVIGILADSTQVSNPIGLAVDANYSVYVADAGNNRILKLNTDSDPTVLASGLTNLVGVAVDAAGDVFYAQAGTFNSVYKIPVGGGSTVTVGQSYVGTIQGIALDAGGGVYIAASGGYELIAANLVTYELLGFNGPLAIALDEQGDLYQAYTSSSGGQVAISARDSGSTTLYAQVGSTNEQSFTIQNTGNTPLTFSSFIFSNIAFSYDPDGTSCVTVSPLAPNNTCNLVVAFAPTTPQVYTGTLTITSNSLNGTATTSQYTLNGQTPQSTTTYTVSPNPSNAGQSVTFTASVSGTFYNGSSFVNVTPTGTVDFINVNNNNAVLGSGTLTTVPGAGQQATFTSTTLPTGSYNVRARYNGSSTVGGSLSDPTTVVVNGRPTTTTLAVSASTIAQGQPETLTATISGGTTLPLTGTVQFLAGSNVLATVPVTATSTGGTATYTTSTLGVGTQSLTAFYSGDANYAADGSNAQQVIVQATGTASLSLSASSVTVPYRTPVTLTATALNSSRAPLTIGQVFFCDVSATICNATYNLGTAQLNSSGVAMLSLAPGTIGAHQFVASLISTSITSGATAKASVTVTGTYPTTSTLTSSGTVGNYNLTGTVVGLGSRQTNLTGQVTFQDVTANSALGTATLGTPILGFTTAPASGSPNAVGLTPYGVATGDFNGDGFQDVVTENYDAGTVSILLGNGDGTFKPQVTYPVGSLPERVLVADFNADGKADLVVANTGSGSVSILLGNGDGTFQPQVTYPASSPVGLGVMDLNNDGIADLAVGDYYSNTFSVLLGNGDGTFKTAVTYQTGNTPQTLAEGDFNNDGFVDIVVGNLYNNSVGIFLNNGDGTFKPQVTYAVGGNPQGVQVGDFNGDHSPDLAVSNSADGTISILIGNGDGTFKPQVTYPVGSDPVGLVIADFNGDGIQDLSTGNTGNIGTQTAPLFKQSILLGNGDGTFQPQTMYTTGNFPYGEAAADFDGDGYPDLAIANFNDNTATILLSQVTTTATATLPNVALRGTAGTHNVDVSYPATGTFAASVSPAIQLTSAGFTAAATATTLSIAPATATVGQPVTFAVAVAGTTQTTPVPTGTVTLTNISVSPAVTVGTVTLGSTGTASFSTSTLPIGGYTIAASYSGDTNYAASTSSAQTLSITNSTVSKGATSTVTNGGVAPGSPLDYTFFGNTHTEDGLPPGGQPTVLTDFAVNVLSNVEYPGNGNYTRITAPGGTAAFTTGTVTDNPTNYPNTTPHTTLLATFSPLKAGSFSVNILDGNTDGIYVGNASVGLGVNGGPAVVTASQHLSGTNEFTTYTILNASPSDVFQVYATTSTNSYPSIGGLTFTVGVPMSTTTSLAVSAANIAPGQSETLTATIAGIPSPAETGMVTFSDQSRVLGTAPVTATPTGGTASLTLTTLSTGTHQITAAYSGDANNLASVSAAQTVVVALAAQTITFPAISSHTIEDAPFTLAATASSGLTVTYTLVSGPATLSGNTVTLTGATGTVIIQASQSGNTTYAAAPTVTQTFTVTGAPTPTLTAITPSAIITGSAATTITLTGTNFNSADILRLNGTATIAATFVSATTLTAVIPASALATAGTIQVSVNDPIGKTTSNALTITVSRTPAVVFTGPTTPPASGQQPTLTFQLTNPYPVPLTASFNLLFAPAVTPAVDDPAIQFASGGRNFTFTIAANSVVTPAIQLQAGTEAGTITVPVTLTAQGVDVTPTGLAPVVIVIPPAAPVVNLVTMNATGGAVNVIVTGYSNTREATQAHFHFTAAPGADLNTPDFTANINPLFGTWYGSAASDPYGSTVVYTQSFTLDSGTASTITGVTVTLTNSVGTSNTGSSQ